MNSPTCGGERRSRRIVVKTWKYADDLLFRLACYRDPDLPHKPLNEVQDAADFATIRVHGFLQSRDYQEILADFLKEAWGGNKKDSAESS